MAVPVTLADLDEIAANNSPSGSDPIGTTLDDFLRAHASLIKLAYLNGGVPAGTRQPFAQAAAPTGWTQDTTDNANNRMLRVVNTAGGGVAGSSSPILNDVVPSHTHAFTSGNQSVLHTHTDSGHAHLITSGTNGSSGEAGAGVPLYASTWSSVGYANLGTESAYHTHSGTTNANGSPANWTPRYIDMIICAKN